MELSKHASINGRQQHATLIKERAPKKSTSALWNKMSVFYLHNSAASRRARLKTSRPLFVRKRDGSRQPPSSVVTPPAPLQMKLSPFFITLLPLYLIPKNIDEKNVSYPLHCAPEMLIRLYSHLLRGFLLHSANFIMT